MISFFRTIDPNEIAVKFIENAVKRTPANTAKSSVVLRNIRNNKGDLFLILNNYNTVGIVYVLTYSTAEGRIICPVLVGGENIKEWHDDLRKFLIGLKQRSKAIAINFIARKGWERLYPECRNIGTIYEFRGGLAE